MFVHQYRPISVFSTIETLYEIALYLYKFTIDIDTGINNNNNQA